MKTAAVPSGDVAASGVLLAAYYVGRDDGESVEAWARRVTADTLEKRAVVHEKQAARLREQAAEIRRHE